MGAGAFGRHREQMRRRRDAYLSDIEDTETAPPRAPRAQRPLADDEEDISVPPPKGIKPSWRQARPTAWRTKG